MKKLKILLVFLTVIIVALLVGYFLQLKISTKVVSNSLPAPTINITYQNLAVELSKNSMIKALPDDSILLLKLYNFNSGEMQGEKMYVIKKVIIAETSKDEKADITITLNSKYLKELTNKNFCSVIQKANNNGDLGFETEMSTVSLAWKFKSMYKYRSCLGF